MSKKLKAHVRWMIRRDMAEVLDIENDSFPLPWDEATFVHHLRARNCIGMVAEYGEKIVGYMLYELHKERLHLLNFAVARKCRRRGVGRQMVSKLLIKLSKNRRTHITLDVSEGNLPAQFFFRQQGFRAVRILHDEYPECPDLDAYRMVLRRYAPVHIEDKLCQ